MKKILVIAALLAFSTSAQAQSDEQKLCLKMAASAADYFWMWRANMDPKEVIRSFRSATNNEEMRDVITLVISANYYLYQTGNDEVSAKLKLTESCKRHYQ